MFPSVDGRMNHLLGKNLVNSIHDSLGALSAIDPTMSLLKTLGPNPSFLGNDYAKRMATFGLAANRSNGLDLFTESVRIPWGTTIPGTRNSVDIGAKAVAAMSSKAGWNTYFAAVKAPLARNTENLFVQRPSIQNTLYFQFEKQFAGIRESVQSVFTNAFKQYSVPSLRDVFFSANLRDLDDEFTLDDIWSFVCEYGVPLMYVPRARIAVRLLRAENKQEIQEILDHEFNNIVDDCEIMLDGLASESLFEHREFVQEAIDVMRLGYTKAAQALLTVVLDTLAYQLRPISDESKFKKAIISYHTTAPNQQVEIEDELTIKAALVWFPVREVHQKFRRQDFEAVPSEYGRHPSVHGVRRCQFPKRNCVHALMVVSSIMGRADELIRQTKL